MIGMALALAFSSTQEAAPLADRASITQCDKPNAEQTATFERRRANIRKSGLFFEERLWTCPEDGLFEAEWYSKHLSALEEPSFALPAASKGYQWRYRYFILAEFSHGTAIRIEKMQNGSARIIWAEETGAGGFDPGRLKEKVSKPLPAFAANELDDLVGKFDLMKDRFGAVAGPTPSGTVCISNFGGAIERIDSSGHHTVAEIGCDAREGADRVSQLMNELSYHYLGKARVRDWFARD